MTIRYSSRSVLGLRHEWTDRRHWGQEQGQGQELEGVRSSRQDLRTVVCAESLRLLLRWEGWGLGFLPRPFRSWSQPPLSL